MSRARILLMTPDYPPNQGGVARYLESLVNYLGDRVTIVTDGLLFRHLWPKWGKTVVMLMKRQSSYDIVLLSHVLPFGTAAWIASWFTKKPYMVILHGMDVRLAQRSVLKRFITYHVLAHAQLVVANSQALATEVTSAFHVSLPLTVYPCVEPRLIHRPSTPQNTLKLLSISRLVERKGHVLVLLALAQLKQTAKIKTFRYDIAGDGPLRKSLEQFAHELHLSEVVFHGEITHTQKNVFYAQADLFLLPVFDHPLDKEGFGLVFLEAAQYAVPSISTNISGVNEAVIHRETGLLVPAGNLDALVRAIAELANDKELRHRLGEQAKKRCEQTFTCQKQFKKLDVYL